MATPATHLRKRYTVETACGERANRYWTLDPNAVTCRRCRATEEWWDLSQRRHASGLDANELPNLANDEARRASVFAMVPGSPLPPRPVGQMLVAEICDQYAKLTELVPRTDWAQQWITALGQELEYRALRHAYETQTQGRYDNIG